jgi:hypothetical protein
MSSDVRTVDTFDAGCLSLSAPVKVVGGGVVVGKVYINCAAPPTVDSEDSRPSKRTRVPKGKLLVQTPTFPKAMLKVWGMGMQEKRTAAFPLDDEEAIDKFITNILEPLHETIIKAACADPVEWFGRQLSASEVRSNFKPCVKPSSDPNKWSDLFSAQINMENGRVARIKCWDSLEYETQFNDVCTAALAGSPMRAIIEMPTVWIASNRTFGVTCYVRALQFFPTADGQKSDGLQANFPFAFA